MENLRVTLIQTRQFWEDKAANLQQFEQKLSNLGGSTDLIILPEMFTTGFSMAPKQLAEPMEGPTMQWLKQMAAHTKAVVTGSFIAEEKGNYFNRLVWMRPDGNYQTYDKKHLFTLAKEHHHYTAGTKRLLVELKGWKIHPLICYDLRFPAWSRNVDDYDLLFYVANWPDKRSAHWKALLVARAIENQCYTIGVNRVGSDKNGHYYSGDSSLIDYSGQVLFHHAHFETIETLSLSYENQQSYREKLNFLPDRDVIQIS